MMLNWEGCPRRCAKQLGADRLLDPYAVWEDTVEIREISKSLMQRLPEVKPPTLSRRSVLSLAGYWRHSTSWAGSMPFLARKIEKKFFAGLA
jgi:hypothetical protein